MRRCLLLVAILLSASTLDGQVRLRFVAAAPPPALAPGVPTNLQPQCNSTGVSLSPTISFTSTGATSYSLLGPDLTNPPTTPHALGATPSYSASGLSQLTTYYWIPTGTNANGSTPYPVVCAFTTGPSSGPSTFVNHPRLLLTSSKLTTLTGRKNANTAEYATMKAYVDTYVENGCDFANCRKQTTTLSASLGTGGASTTFTVVDGSWLPTGAFDLRIDLEVIGISSRSGNTLTIAARGKAYSDVTANVSHAAGANVWYHDPSDFNGLVQPTAMLGLLGVTGYDIAARYMLNEIAVYFSPASMYTGDNAIRWFGFFLALGFDWNYANLTSNEKSVYCGLMALSGDDHIANPKEGGVSRVSLKQAIMAGNNISNGQIRSVLAMAAACAGESAYPLAQSHWDTELAKVTGFILPAMNGGATTGGLFVEGSEYGQTDYVQLIDIISIIESAVNDTTIVDTADEWYGRAVTALLYLTVPGTTNSTTQTTGTCTSGSPVLTVASSTSFAAGQNVYLNGGLHLTTIVDVSGTTWTLRDPCPASYTNTGVGHQQMVYAYGDVENNPNYGDFPLTGGEPQTAVAHAQARLITTDPTLASYAEYWLDNVAPLGLPLYISWKWFFAHDPNVTPVDYTALPNSFSTDDPDAMGFMVAKNNWSATGTAMYLIAGHEVYDHGTSYFCSYGIRRKGAYVTRHLEGYGATGISPPYPLIDIPTAGKTYELPYVGAAWHNTVWMNGHTALTPFVDLAPGPASLARSAVTSTYSYGRCDASNVYTYAWTSLGYANNDAQTFVRDWLAIPGSDLMVFHDRLVYANATTSPTTWFIQTPGNPSVTAQRLTMTYGGQTLAQDILLPTSAVFSEVDQQAENAYLRGYRTLVRSGISASTEYGFHVLQVGDSGFSPVSVTTLTTTNADVAQIGTTYVAGFVKGPTPTLNISYVLSGTPRNLVCGMAVSTAYHVTRATNTITIAVATGSGDTTSTAAGCLDFTL